MTKQDNDKGAFKTPTLRQVTATAPHMQGGSEATLESVVELYVKGGNPNPRLDPEMKPLTLTDQDKKGLGSNPDPAGWQGRGRLEEPMPSERVSARRLACAVAARRCFLSVTLS